MIFEILSEIETNILIIELLNKLTFHPKKIIIKLLKLSS
jgi:hypothetical protein